MARTPSTEDVYEGDGVTAVFQFHFPFLHASDVFVSVDGVNVSFTILPGSIAQVQTTVPPADGTVVKVYRSTLAYIPEHLFASGVPFLPRYVDENNRQLLYASQEAINDTAVTAAEALVVAEEAKQIAQEAEDKIDGAIIDSSYQLRLDLANPDLGAALVAVKALDGTPFTLADLVNPPAGGNLVGWQRVALEQAAHNTVTGRLSMTPLNLLEFAHLVTVKPAGIETWDWAPALTALTAAARESGLPIELPPFHIRTSVTFVVPAGNIARGSGSGGYITEIVDPAMWKTVITKINGNTGGSYVVDVEKAAQIFDVQAAPEDRSYAVWDSANYLPGSGNVNSGFRLQQAARAQGCTAIAFPDDGFEIGMITKCTDCYAFMCTQGFRSRLNEGDASIVECIAMFCYQFGADLRGGYWKVIGGRFEWNARHGIAGSASFTCNGTTFDRNGWAGLYLPEGYEQDAINGCTFRRNGAGGDGVVGRTSWMIPSHPGYVFTSVENSCHIRIDSQRRVTIAGNSYAPGTDDAGGGADAPRHVYTSGLPTGSTALDGINLVGNSGDRDEASPGYAPTYNGGGAATWGGSDQTLISYFGPKGTYIPIAARSDFFQGSVPQTASAVTSIAINVPKSTSGKVTLSLRQAFAGELSEVYFAVGAGNGSPGTKVVNHIGVNVTGASLVAGPGDFNVLTVTFVAACFVKYHIITT